MAKNQLSGTFPNILWDLPRLGVLNLSNNGFQGSLTTDIGRADGLQFVFLSSIQLSGTIPTEIGLFDTLIEFRASSALLEGNIPTEFGLHRRMSKFTEKWLTTVFSS